MITSQQSLEQEVLQDNKEIFSRLVSELKDATFELLIASAWFTDEDLFNIVKEKAAQGVTVKVIIADNQENQKLPFDELVTLGGSVTRVKGAGYGNMNQKFCVIDKSIALHGSYN
jgi:phosphatidylserine/phosphatidylglycerophosphate/cardiolipin synthase-like enzyme